jgi:hypothetical protein
MKTLISLLSQPATVSCKKTLNHKPEPSPQSPFLSIIQNTNTPNPQMYKLMLSAQTITRLSVIKHQSSAHNKGPYPQGFITILECIFTFQLHKPSQSRVYASGGFKQRTGGADESQKTQKALPPPRLRHRRKKAKPNQEETCTHLHLPLCRVVGESNAIICQGKNPFSLEKKLSQ